ncbi:hypothetical protein GCM10009854_14910 [Saccharopolyspora halophila]|uniref:DUF6194 domain-containing protein n=2 Tax=Saccharopolyspora halophila TaxID=405551 RepID=A0ABP5SV59_9PSEU
MTMGELIEFVAGLGGVVVLKPVPGDGTPEIAWGDAFFYYSPEGIVPGRTQPFATIVTKNYPGEAPSGLDRPGAFRVNIRPDKEAFIRWIGRAPREPAIEKIDPAVTDAFVAHPLYGTAGWVSVINPAEPTREPTRDLLRAAHRLARARCEQQQG